MRKWIVLTWCEPTLPGQVVLKHCCRWRSCPLHWYSGSPGGQTLFLLMEPVSQEALQGLHGPHELQLLQPSSSVGPPSGARSEESGQSPTPLHTLAMGQNRQINDKYFFIKHAGDIFLLF